MNVKFDIEEKLAEKGYIADINTVDLVLEKFTNALIMNGYWDILDQTIEESDIRKLDVTFNTVLVGKEYIVIAASYIKSSLHNKKVRVLEKMEEPVGTLLVEVLEGHMKGKKVGIEPENLKKAMNGKRK